MLASAECGKPCGYTAVRLKPIDSWGKIRAARDTIPAHCPAAHCRAAAGKMLPYMCSICCWISLTMHQALFLQGQMEKVKLLSSAMNQEPEF
jgi:hypothetical protein